MKKLSQNFSVLPKPAALLAASFACLAALGLTKSYAAPVQAAPAQTVPIQTAPRLVRLPGHLAPNVLRRSALLGWKTDREAIPLGITLPLRDRAGLERLLQRQYTPGDPLFHHFITPTEFTSRFSPTQQTYDAAVAFARSNGLSVTHLHANRLLLDVSGPAAVVEKAFHVRLQNYTSGDGRLFHAPNAEPSVPAALFGKISGVIGLQNSIMLRTHLRQRSASPAEVGSGLYGGLTPADIAAAYNLSGTTLTGQGRTLGLYELDGYTPSDISGYESTYGLPAVPLNNVLVDGGVGTPGGGAGEVTLDIELMTALAPGATAIYVYEAPNGLPGIIDCYAQMADDNIAKEISSSWGEPETNFDDVTRQAEATIFQQMAAQGQSIYAAAGDSGAYDDGKDLGVDDPASQPYVTGVGGTALNVVSPGGAYASETTWNDTVNDPGHPAGGGGGVSVELPVPDYQKGVPGLYSPSQRNVPDVALSADTYASGYSIYFDGSFTVYGGTSCAAPLWAAFTALVNQQRQINQETDLGFPNPTIYQIAGSANYNSAFHDIYDGSNNLYPGYRAVRGYDDATGWGSFNGLGLLAQMAPAIVVTANPVSSVVLTPASVVGGLTSSGVVTLANPAPASGATVTLAVTGGPASVPATVAVAAGATTGNFTVTTAAVTASTAVTVSASYSGGSQSATLTLLPPPAQITPLSLTLSPDTVGNGASSVGTVTLTGPAPATGSVVTLTSSDPSATVPATVTVPSGAVSATFAITTVPVTTQVLATISATLNGTAQTAVLTVQAPTLEPIILTPTSLIGGDSATLALALTLPAPTGGAAITLTSGNPAAVLPASVTIPAGQTTASVTVTTTAVTAATPVTLTAVYNGVTKTTVLTVKPPLLQAITLAPATVIGGSPSVGTLSLGAAAPSTGLTATVTSSDPAAKTPATVIIPPGATAVSFPLPTANVSLPVSATITASLGTAVVTAVLTIQPVQVASLVVSPASVVTGTAAAGTVTLNAPAPAGGLSVTLASTGPAATVPAVLVVPAGTVTAPFTVATPHAGSVTISASLAGAAQTAKLTVSGAPGTTYPAGIGLISAPYDYSGTAPDSLFGYTGVVLGTWQPGSGAYALTPTAPADTLHIGHGYWVNLPTAVTLSTVGTPADPTKDFAITLSPGWNQIGQPFPTGETVGSLNVSAGGTAVPFDQAASSAPLLVSSLVYRYAPGQGTTPGGYIWVRDTDSLQPGLGYWIYAYQAVTLIVPHH